MRRGLAAVSALAIAVGGCGARPVMPEFDPGVRGNFGGEFFWGSAGGPDRSLPFEADPESLRAAAAQINGAVSQERWEAFSTRVVAVFPTPAEAESQAATLRSVLAASAEWFSDPANQAAEAALVDPERLAPLTEPEIKAVLASGNAPTDRGIGWGGSPDEAGVAVTTVGTLLAVTGMEVDQVTEPGPPEPHPLVAMLSGYGAEVVTEGELFAETTGTMDISCRVPDDAAGTRLLDEVGDAFIASEYHLIPPWVSPPTAEHALARATIRRWQQAAFRAFEDATYRGYLDRLVASIDDPDEYRAILAEMSAYMAQRAPELVDGPVDTEGLTLIAGRPDSDSEAHRTWLLAIGERLGQHPLELEAGDYLFPAYQDWATESIVGMVRLHDGRIEIGSTSFVRFSTGGLQLFAYLQDSGCTDIRFGFLDYNELGGG